MRAREFVAEAKTVEYNGLSLRIKKPTSYELRVEALDDWGNNVLGYVEFDIGDDRELDPQDLRVDDRYQGQGIAKTMYDYVKSLGYKIVRSWDQTDAGAGFWDKHRGEDVRVWESFLGEANASAVQFQTASADNYQSSFTVTAISNGKTVGHFSFFRDPETDDVHNQAEVTDDVQGKGYGKALLLKAIEVANDHGLGFQEDSQSLSRAQSRVYDSLYDAGWIVDADGYWFLTPEGEQELTRLSTMQQGVAEAFDNPYKTKTEKSDYGDVDMLAKLPDGTNLSIMFNHEGDNEWQVEFYRDNSQEVTGQGDAQRIFATVLAAIQKFVKKYQPDVIKFSAEKSNNSDSRSSLYDRLVSRFAQQLGYNDYSEEYMSSTMYELSKQSQGVAEEQLDELSFLGSECTKDCSGHRAGYEWSKRKGLRQANSWSPSFNKGAGLAVAGK